MTVDELNEKAMEMIVSAGAGRTALNVALDALSEGNKEKYEEMVTEAKAKMKRLMLLRLPYFRKRLLTRVFVPISYLHMHRIH